MNLEVSEQEVWIILILYCYLVLGNLFPQNGNDKKAYWPFSQLDDVNKRSQTHIDTTQILAKHLLTRPQHVLAKLPLAGFGVIISELIIGQIGRIQLCIVASIIWSIEYPQIVAIELGSRLARAFISIHSFPPAQRRLCSWSTSFSSARNVLENLRRKKVAEHQKVLSDHSVFVFRHTLSLWVSSVLIN